MNNKCFTFFAAMSVPLASVGATACTGLCGSCGYGCVPTFLMTALLGGKVVKKKLNEKRRIKYEKA